MTSRERGGQFRSARVRAQPVASNLRALCWRPRNEVGMVMWADHAGLVLFLRSGEMVGDVVRDEHCTVARFS